METTFTVSNTDVITMLMVEQRELLKNKRTEVFEKYIINLGVQTTEVNEKVLAVVKKNKPFNDGLDALNTLFKVLNPKLSFKLDYETHVKNQVSNSISNMYHRHFGNDEKTLELSEIYITIDIDEKDEERFQFPWSNGYDEISLPFKYKTALKVNKETKELSEELNRIDDLLRNENALKEKLIASVTKNAIKDLPEMKALVGNVNLLTN